MKQNIIQINMKVYKNEKEKQFYLSIKDVCKSLNVMLV